MSSSVEKSLRFKFQAPLNEKDTPEQTFGCRADPDICLYADMENVCAFVREDHVCVQPSLKWAKQYYKLKEKQSKE